MAIRQHRSFAGGLTQTQYPLSDASERFRALADNHPVFYFNPAGQFDLPSRLQVRNNFLYSFRIIGKFLCHVPIRGRLFVFVDRMAFEAVVFPCPFVRHFIRHLRCCRVTKADQEQGKQTSEQRLLRVKPSFKRDIGQ